MITWLLQYYIYNSNTRDSMLPRVLTVLLNCSGQYQGWECSIKLNKIVKLIKKYKSVNIYNNKIRKETRKCNCISVEKSYLKPINKKGWICNLEDITNFLGRRLIILSKIININYFFNLQLHMTVNLLLSSHYTNQKWKTHPCVP